MKKRKDTYNLSQLASALFMIMALSWLTISAPFVNAARQQETKTSQQKAPFAGAEEEAPNPFGNSTEEKNSKSSNSTLSEEYLHELHISEYFVSIASATYNRENESTYVAFHGELLVPPPNRS
jgi:hypothetical protein